MIIGNAETNIKLTQKVVEYFTLGYSKSEIIKAMKKETELYCNNDEQIMFDFVSAICEKLPKIISAADYEKVKELRKIHTEEKRLEKYTAIANRVKELLSLHGLPRPLANARDYAKIYKIVGAEFGLASTTVKNAFYVICPDLHNECYKPHEFTEEYFLQIYNKIMQENVPQLYASQIPGYNQMIQYIETNKPELYSALKEFYKKNKTAHGLIDSKNQTLNIKNGQMLINIVLEYRVPLSDICGFVNQNKDIFLKDDTKPIIESELVEILKCLSAVGLQEAIKWYFFETSTPDEFSEYRASKFYEFVNQFASLKDNFKMLKDFINIKVGLPLDYVISKNSTHNFKERYNFTVEDVRTIIKYVYKNALSTRQIPDTFLMDSFDHRNHLAILKQSAELEDQILVKGYERLLDYKRDISFNRNIVGRING